MEIRKAANTLDGMQPFIQFKLKTNDMEKFIEVKYGGTETWLVNITAIAYFVLDPNDKMASIQLSGTPQQRPFKIDYKYEDIKKALELLKKTEG
jgi:hypothetical protein